MLAAVRSSCGNSGPRSQLHRLLHLASSLSLLLVLPLPLQLRPHLFVLLSHPLLSRHVRQLSLLLPGFYHRKSPLDIRHSLPWQHEGVRLRCRSFPGIHDILPQHRVKFATGVNDIERLAKTPAMIFYIPAHMDRALALIGLACGVDERDLFDGLRFASSFTCFILVDDALAQPVVISSLGQLNSPRLVVRYDFNVRGGISMCGLGRNQSTTHYRNETMCTIFSRAGEVGRGVVGPMRAVPDLSKASISDIPRFIF